ncbi:B3 domain-containing protein REM16 [Trifolium repens]|nr:B3 domain-containing protein REM16 [Trifolium repens]
MGGGSKSWEEDIYWTHFQFIHFTQFLRNDFHQQLALPKTFSNNVKKKLPEIVTLKGPSGVVWNVGLTTRDDTLYFTIGWQQFVKDHSLKENDFLVFKYNGESHFEVLIFDGESFCEKAASYFVRKCGHAQTEQRGSKAKDTNTATEEVINTASNGGVECGSPENFQRLNSIGTPLDVAFVTTNETTFNTGIESASPEQFMADAVTETTPVVVPSQTTGKRTKKPVNEVMPDQTKKRGTSPKAANSSERALEKEHSEAAIPCRSGNEDDRYTLRGAKLSKFSEPNEKEIAQSYTSSFPYFVKIMKSFNVGGSCLLNIPTQFSKAHFPNHIIKIILHNLKGEQWTVNCVNKSIVHHTHHILCGGWIDFVRCNGIKVGDVCIFELIREYEFRVRIAEVGKNGLDFQDEKLDSSA